MSAQLLFTEHGELRKMPDPRCGSCIKLSKEVDTWRYPNGIRCRRCGGMFYFRWYTREGVEEKRRERQEMKELEMMRKEEAADRRRENERKAEAKKNLTQVVLIDRFAKQVTKTKKRSREAEYQAKRKAGLSEDQKERAKEIDKIRKREERKQERIDREGYEYNDEWKQAGASRMAKCRHNKDEQKMKEANEKAKVGMRECNKRKKEALASEDGHWYAPRTKRSHPITRKNVSRILRYIKETGTYVELIYYWNEEKKMWLYMDPSGVHYRRKYSRRPLLNADGTWNGGGYVDADDDYEIVQLDNNDHMDLLVLKNSKK